MNTRPVVTAVRPGDVRTLARTLRPSDREEITGTSGRCPAEILDWSVSRAAEVHAVRRGEELLALFGVNPHPAHPAVGIPWLLAAPEFEDLGVILARRSRTYVERFNARYPILVNFVSAANVKAVAWLKWCGFRLAETPVVVGPGRVPCLYFEKRRNDHVL